MIVYIDTEVNPQTKKVADYGAVREDGAVLHTSPKADFDAFVSGCDAVCGHNIIGCDLKYTSLIGTPTIIDTLFLSPLLFPKRPYHHLVKDDKLQVDELNNPVNDSMKARDLLNDEINTWNQLSSGRKEIYYQLLREITEFEGFFKYIGYTSLSRNSFWSRLLNTEQAWAVLILTEFRGKICSNADFSMMAKQYPIELAYSLAVIGADDIFSITPAWVLRNYPQVVNVMNLLCNTSCGDCDYCHQSAIQDESILTIFPTGGGKSLTFQLPALMAGRNIHGLTVVISPLQSLMKDQVDNLAARGISEAVTINGLLDPIERATAIQQVAEGTANLLYIAPEMWNDDITISKEKWQEAKRRTLEKYASSSCLSVMQHFFASFEETHSSLYRSDLREYIFESNIEDFIAADEKSIFVSTIHKAKGREFDTVYLLSPIPDVRDVSAMRSYYVGLTRAKHNLYLATTPLSDSSSICIALNMHDVKLDFFKGRKEIILRLQSGDNLLYKDDYLFNEQGVYIAVLSTSGKEKLKVWTDRAYSVTEARVSFTLAWKPANSQMEYGVCLANMVLTRKSKS